MKKRKKLKERPNQNWIDFFIWLGVTLLISLTGLWWAVAAMVVLYIIFRIDKSKNYILDRKLGLK
jgi:uncharacterized protein (DUF983 family)